MAWQIPKLLQDLQCMGWSALKDGEASNLLSESDGQFLMVVQRRAVAVFL